MPGLDVSPSASIAQLRRWLEQSPDWIFLGSVQGSIYAALRIGIGAIFLVRHSDWLRPWLFLEHHRFVHGLMFLASSSAAEPVLKSPLAVGFTLSPATNDALVYVRTGLALLLLLGIRVRVTAAMLALVSYVLLAADRYRYYHHLWFLYVSVAWLAFCPSVPRFSVQHMHGRVARALFGKKGGAISDALEPAPIWPLQLIRALVLSVYLAAGVSKLDAQWLRGESLEHLERLQVLAGPVWTTAREWIGYRGMAVLSCSTELLLVVLLASPQARRAGVIMGWAFHAGISLSMPVYSFGAQMAVLLLAFWPRPSKVAP